MPRIRVRYDFIGEINAIIDEDISNEETAINTWLPAAWMDAKDKIESEFPDSIEKYEIQEGGNLLHIETSTAFASVLAANAAVGLDQLPTGIRVTVKNRNVDNLFVYYGDGQDEERAFIIKGIYLWHFAGNDTDAIDLLKNAGRASLKHYGAAYAEPGEAASHTAAGDDVIENFETG